MIDISQKYSNSLVNVACADFAKQGKLPPANLRPPVLDLSVSRIGLMIRPMPEGAYVVATTAGSASSRAGLTPGTVITRANGIALAGLGGAMTKILDSEAAVLTLETATGGRVEVITAP
jgi:S1-C subfamily serine protease